MERDGRWKQILKKSESHARDVLPFLLVHILMREVQCLCHIFQFPDIIDVESVPVLVA
jgi:hypothetical protein